MKGMRAKSSSKRSQNAMEYLVTYSWAIIIILIMLGLFYTFGDFNLNFLSPRASTGSCYVYRPQGAGSTYLIAYAGTCNNELPDYATVFKGQNNYMYVPRFSGYIAGSQISMGLWAYALPASNGQGFGGMSNGVDTAFYIEGSPNVNDLDCAFQNGGGQLSIASPLPIPSGEWHYFVITYDGNLLSCYMDGQLVGRRSLGSPLGYVTNTMVSLDAGYIDGSIGQYMQGDEANVQFYNTSLSANDIVLLYTRGIGSAPVNLQSLVGWWPLNGDLNDYSGNGYNGAEFASNPTLTGLTYTTNWQNGYSLP